MGEVILPNFKTAVMKTVVVLVGREIHRPIEERIKNRPTQILTTDFDEGAKAIQWKKDNHFKKCCWNKWL